MNAHMLPKVTFSSAGRTPTLGAVCEVPIFSRNIQFGQNEVLEVLNRFLEDLRIPA